MILHWIKCNIHYAKLNDHKRNVSHYSDAANDNYLAPK